MLIRSFFFINWLKYLLLILFLSTNLLAITINLKNAIEWDSTSGHTYQFESTDNGVDWISLGSEQVGNNNKLTYELSSTQNGQQYRIQEIIPGVEVPNTTIPNNSFELENLSDWSAFGSPQPTRSDITAKNGSYSARLYVNKDEGTGLESKLISSNISEINGEESYTLSFWAQLAQSGPSLVIQYQVTWRGTSTQSTGLTNFSLDGSDWQKISIPNLVAPAGANEAEITYRMAIGHVDGAKGEIFIDEVELSSGSVSSTDQVAIHENINPQRVAEISIPTEENIEYFVYESSNLEDWSNTDVTFVGSGSHQIITLPAQTLSKFVRVMIPEYTLFAPTDARASSSLQSNSIELSWNPSPTPTVQGYRIYYGTEISNLDQSIEVIGETTATISGLTVGQEYYFAVVAYNSEGQSAQADTLFSATPTQSITLIPLNDANTVLEPETTIDHEDALITYIADRGRDRHAREGALAAAQYPNNNFNRYDFYLKDYWVGRYYSMEIIDRIAKGGSSITLNITSSHPLEAKDTRLIYLGETTPAQYAFNSGSDGHKDINLDPINDVSELNQYYEIDPLIIQEQGPQFPKKGYGEYYYSATLDKNYQGRNISIGDRIEIEFSPFLLNDVNYYGTAFLYIVGEGIAPWYGIGDKFDSYPLPESTLLGGYTTQHQRFTNTQYHSFKQMAGNLAPINSERFMLGRRIHHTNFQTGVHSEQPNDDFVELKYKLGPDYINNSCIACHINNGKGALPSGIGTKMTNSVTRIGSDASGSFHQTLGSVLQSESFNGTPEGLSAISNWVEETFNYGDGNEYSLRYPEYSIPNGIDYYSVRLAPHIWGTGLLEAIDEVTILNLQDPEDSNNDGISGRANYVLDAQGDYRIGRFGYKASKYSLKQHIASALNTDMGVTTRLYPSIDYGPNIDTEPEISDSQLDHLYRYISLLALTHQRDFDNPDVIEGEQIFNSINCSACHISNITTGEFHPLTELRNQNIRPFTDLLLHDMGEGLADKMGEGNASGSEWRTAPLWGIGLTSDVGEGTETYLHDGRARTLEEAILWHGGEAEASKEAFRTMSASDRSKLITFLKSL